ncbi:hypothetical protein LCGC14_2354480 [marine sediment metagenome]|uniref:Uncharacterized protein n=1 Tax=marine sediment metagenome TaxID=412755 RepID=A0A0F8VBW7_9ZZZZ
MELIKIEVGIFITTFGGKSFFLTANEYKEFDDCFMADSDKVMMIVAGEKGVGTKKLSEIEPKSFNIKIMKSSIETIESLDNENQMYKYIYKIKSGLVLPGDN